MNWKFFEDFSDRIDDDAREKYIKEILDLKAKYNERQKMSTEEKCREYISKGCEDEFTEKCRKYLQQKALQ